MQQERARGFQKLAFTPRGKSSGQSSLAGASGLTAMDPTTTPKKLVVESEEKHVHDILPPNTLEQERRVLETSYKGKERCASDPINDPFQVLLNNKMETTFIIRTYFGTVHRELF